MCKIRRGARDRSHDPRMVSDDDQRFMRMAIERAELGARLGGWPFGAVVVREREVLAVCCSTEEIDGTVTAHAEMNAIRRAATRLGSLELRGCTIYSTHECCVLCSGAALHAKLSRIVMGTRRADRPDLFRTRRIPIEDILSDSLEPPAVEFGVCHAEALALFDGVSRESKP